jgi:cyclic beta-1,2-glucan synthetase
MLALSALVAWRLGHIGLPELVLRMQAMLATLERLPKWHGHILNWYDTTTLQPLEPRYVSSVDSGNLAASLVVLSNACDTALAESPVGAERWRGLDDCLRLLSASLAGFDTVRRRPAEARVVRLRETIQALSDHPLEWLALATDCAHELTALQGDLVAVLEGAATAPAGEVSDLSAWLDRTHHHLDSLTRDFATLTPWLGQRSGDATRETLSKLLESPLQACGTIYRRISGEVATRPLRRSVSRGLAQWRKLERQVNDIAHRAQALAEGMDFAPLYDRDRRLLHIGYDVSAGRIDHHHYDLMASEARLASFLAIAKLDVPTEHWLHLGRPIVKRRHGLALVSWNGSMFEYLMPSMFLRSDPSTLLGESERSAVAMQRAYASIHRVPWGISESGFGSVGGDGSWRYRAFGVPDLGLRRGLGEDLVIAPYASALALGVAPREAAANLRALAERGMLARYGFYEALDFTAGRRDSSGEPTQVRSFMAHHQGMTLGAIGNALCNNILVEWFHADPRIQTVDLLLNERIPWELPPELSHGEDLLAAAAPPLAGAPRPQPWAPRQLGRDAVHALGNGRLALQMAGDGSSTLAWQGIAVGVPGGPGHCFSFRNAQCHEPAAPVFTQAPAARRTTFHAHKVEFRHEIGGVARALVVFIAPNEDVEIRRLRLVNQTASEHRLEVASRMDLALAPPGRVWPSSGLCPAVR